ncbi:hypothetical protein [Acidisphaera sp. S103]|uniref:hypothetical protein n=1 Tax=Acidisphaera sp. S103 TaxID=1747223 RepID=UPI00131CB173|nr:hypothetical protein [Acidisphaera sp. S103]
MTAPALEMMRCDKRSMTLSKAGCARLWLSAQEDRPKEWEGRFACIGCRVGAMGAGKPMPVTTEAVEAWRNVCPRCRRPAQRMIGNRFCVSCWNRNREATVMKNSKGNPPQVLLARLHSEIVAVSDGAATRVVREESVVDLAEIIVLHARAATGALAFSRPAAVHAG